MTSTPSQQIETTPCRNGPAPQERIEAIDISPSKLLDGDRPAHRPSRDAPKPRPKSTVAVAQRERADFANYKRRTAEER